MVYGVSKSRTQLSDFTFTFHFQGSLTWRREWQPTLVFLPGEFHGQRSLAGCSPQESDMTEEPTHTHTHKAAWISSNVNLLYICHILSQGKARSDISIHTDSRHIFQAGIVVPTVFIRPCWRCREASLFQNLLTLWWRSLYLTLS